MSEENVALIRGMVESFNTGKVEDVLAQMDPEITWNEPGGGNSPSGTFTGPASVAQDVFATVPGTFEEFSVNVDEYRDEGDTVVIVGSYKGKSKNGTELDASFENPFEVENGKVTSATINIKDPDHWAEAWS